MLFFKNFASKNSDLIFHRNQPKKREISVLVADTFVGKIHIQYDPQAQVTSLGQLPFFIQFLKVGRLFQPWVDECPLSYTAHGQVFGFLK